MIANDNNNENSIVIKFQRKMVCNHRSNTSRTDIKENEYFSLSKFVAIRKSRSPTATRQDQRRTDAGQSRNMSFELDAAHPQATTQVFGVAVEAETRSNHSRSRQRLKLSPRARVCSVSDRAVLPVELDSMPVIVLNNAALRRYASRAAVVVRRSSLAIPSRSL